MGVFYLPEESVPFLMTATVQADLPVDVTLTESEALALTCHQSPVLWGPAPISQITFLRSYLPNASVGEWSPNGKRVLVFTQPSTAVVDFSTQALTWLPADMLHASQARWVNDTLVAYWGIWHDANGVTDSARRTFNLFDVHSLKVAQPTLSPVWDYALSPDHTRIALTLSDEGRNPNGPVLMWMPATGGDLRTLDDRVTSKPVWSPDGQSVLYTHYNINGPSYSMHIARPKTGEIRDLLKLPSANAAPLQPIDYAWAPESDQIAVVIFGSTSGAAELVAYSLLLLKPDGAEVKRVHFDPKVRTNGSPLYSADGRYLAVSVLKGVLRFVLVYETATGDLVRTLPNFITQQWSPVGHQLLLDNWGERYLLRAPNDLRREPEKVTDACLPMPE
jgi:hypothetical protein